MFDFVRKSFVWSALDRDLLSEIGQHSHFHLKTIQDLAVYDLLRGSEGLVIAEVGGGDSRILRALAGRNTCFNVEKFQGVDGGPRKEITIPNVTNVPAFLGEFSGLLPKQAFDVVFSVSVVEHIPTANLAPFLEEGVECLKPGGLWLHAIDLYIEDNPGGFWEQRYTCYLGWLKHPALTPIGPVHDAPLRFSCSMASNPDNVMRDWKKIAPQLDELRQRAQSVSLLVAMRKTSLSEPS